MIRARIGRSMPWCSMIPPWPAKPGERRWRWRTVWDLTRPNGASRPDRDRSRDQSRQARDTAASSSSRVWNPGRAARLDVLALDRGPGMSDVDRCLADGYSTAGSPGTGLGAIGRLADQFDIYSSPETRDGPLALRRCAIQCPEPTAPSLNLAVPERCRAGRGGVRRRLGSRSSAKA